MKNVVPIGIEKIDREIAKSCSIGGFSKHDFAISFSSLNQLIKNQHSNFIQTFGECR